MSLRLDHLDRFPTELADIALTDIKTVFANPTLISVEGIRSEPLFISTLLHGNETTSFDVLRYLQRTYGDRRPPRSLLVFVGNVEAATKGLRRLDGQPDFNRIWDQGDSSEHALAREVISIARGRDLLASIDIHNNTGKNPLYGCVNALRPADLQLARMFAPRGVVYRNPSSTQSIAFSQLCPAITLECGQSGDAAGLAAATGLVDAVMRLDHFDLHPPAPEALQLYETVGRVVLDSSKPISLGPTSTDLALQPGLDSHNFTTLREGAVLARTAHDTSPLRVVDEHGRDMTDAFLSLQQGEIQLVRSSIPAMITMQPQIIRQDCLCYLMERL